MEHYIYQKAYTPKKIVEQISDIVDPPPPPKFNIPKMSSTDAIIHAAQDLFNALKDPSPDIPVGTPGNSHKEALKYLAEIFGKATSPTVPPRVPVRGSHQEEFQQANQE